MNWWQRLRVRVPQTRYEAEWDLYSREWEGKVREVDEVHLGDGWATPSFTMQIVERFCRPYLKQKLMCLDVSEAMLARTRERLSDRPNVRLVKGDGLTLRPLARRLAGLVVSFHTFVHLGIEDPFRYLAGTPVWRIGGIHLASLLSEEGWRKLVAEAPLHQGGKGGLGHLSFSIRRSASGSAAEWAWTPSAWTRTSTTASSLSSSAGRGSADDGPSIEACMGASRVGGTLLTRRS